MCAAKQDVTEVSQIKVATKIKGRALKLFNVLKILICYTKY